MKTKLYVILLLVISLSAGSYYFFQYHLKHGITQFAWSQHIPEDAAMVVKLDSAASFKQFVHAADVVEQMAAIEPKMAGWHHLVNTWAQQAQGSNLSAALALVPSGVNSWDFLFIMQFPTSGSNEIMDSLIRRKNEGLSYSYRGEPYVEYQRTDLDDGAWSAWSNAKVGIIASKSVVLEKSIDAYQNPNTSNWHEHLENAQLFDRNIFVQLSGLQSLFRTVKINNILPFTTEATANGFASFSTASTDDASTVWLGETKWINAPTRQLPLPGQNTIIRQIPSKTAMLWWSRHYKPTHDSLADDSNGLHSVKDTAFLHCTEYAFGKMAMENHRSSSHDFAVLRYTQNEELAFLWQKFVLPKTIEDSININANGLKLYYFSPTDSSSLELPSPVIQPFANNNRLFALIREGFLYISPSPQLLINMQDAIDRKETYDNTFAFAKLTERTDLQGSTLFLANPLEMMRLPHDWLPEQAQNGYYKNLSIIQQHDVFLLKFSQLPEGVVTECILEERSDFEEIASTQYDWSFNIDQLLSRGPWVLPTHHKKGFLVFYQDSAHNLKCYNAHKEMLWYRSLENPIRGKPVILDAYQNQKLQYGVLTDENYYVLDRLGRDVASYPLPLNTTKVETASWRHFEGADHLLLTDSAGKTHCYTAKGERLKDWRTPQLDTALCWPWKVAQMQQKTRLYGYGQNGQFWLLNTQGEKIAAPIVSSVPLLSPLQWSADIEDHFFSSDSMGNLVKLQVNQGEWSLKRLGNWPSEHYFEVTDINGDQSSDYFWCAGNRVAAYERSGAPIFNSVLPVAISAKGKVFYLENEWHFLFPSHNLQLNVVNNRGVLVKQFPGSMKYWLLNIEDQYYVFSQFNNKIERYKLN